MKNQQDIKRATRLLIGTMATFGGLLSLSAAALADPPAGTAGWTLAFSDDFNGTSLDTTKWTASDNFTRGEIPGTIFKASEVSVSGGNLVLKTEKMAAPAPGGQTWAGGAVDTYGKFNVQSCYVEASIKVSAKNKGIYSAFWLTPVSGWPPELDVMEILHEWPNIAYHTWHYTDNGYQQVQKTSYSAAAYWQGGFGTDYHTFAADYRNNQVTFSVDGTNPQVVNGNNSAGSPIVTHTNPMRILLYHAAGHSWGGMPDSTTGSPLNQYVDWVKVWIKNDDDKNNLALFRPVTSSSGTDQALMVDINDQTRWGTPQLGNQWVQVELERPTNITHVKIEWNAGYAKDYDIQVGNAANGPFNTIKSVRGQTTYNWLDFTGLSGVGRFVRINCLTPGTQWGYSIHELEVYGTVPTTSGPGANVVVNGSFEAQGETQTPTGWNTYSPSDSHQDADFTQIYGSAYDGTLHATHWKSSPYEVSTYQRFSNLPNGLYTLTARIKSSGGQTACQMYARNNNTGNVTGQKTVNIAAASTYTPISIANIDVNNGQAEIGFYSKANGNLFLYFDGIELRKQ